MLRESPDVMHGVVCWATPASKRPRRTSCTLRTRVRMHAQKTQNA